MDSQDELARYKATLKRNLTRLHDSILSKFIQEPDKPHGNVIDDEFSVWWSLFGDATPFEAQDVHKDDIVFSAKHASCDDNENNNNLTMFQTFNDFHRQMKRIIKQIGHFTLLFKTNDRKILIEPNCFWIEKNEDDEELVILGESENDTVWTIGSFCKGFNNRSFLKENEDYRPFPRFDRIFVFTPKDDTGDGQSSDDERQGKYFSIADHFEINPSEKTVEIIIALHH